MKKLALSLLLAAALPLAAQRGPNGLGPNGPGPGGPPGAAAPSPDEVLKAVKDNDVRFKTLARNVVKRDPESPDGT